MASEAAADGRIPRYCELPRHSDLGLAYSWDVWAPDDDLGTINNITEASVRSAAGEVQTGRRYNLSLPLELPDPPMFTRRPFTHHILQLDRRTYDDYLDGFYLQGSSQWDSLLHVRAGRFGLYKGRQAEPAEHVASGGAGLEAWAEHGIVARGVLLDLAAVAEQRGQPIRAGVERRFGADFLREVAEAEGIGFRRGDILLIRTGWLADYLAADAHRRAWLANTSDVAGLHAGEATAEFLWDTGCAAVVADNPTLEASPGDPAIGSLHRRLIPMLGMAVGELWNLEGLAAACRADGRYTCCVVAVPLNLSAAIGSPANAVAIR